MRTDRPKKEPLGWMGPYRYTAHGKGARRFGVIDSTGRRIAGTRGGFESREQALAWIDCYALHKLGLLSPDDHQEFFRHWHGCTASALAITNGGDSRPPDTGANQPIPGNAVPIATRGHDGHPSGQEPG